MCIDENIRPVCWNGTWLACGVVENCMRAVSITLTIYLGAEAVYTVMRDQVLTSEYMCAKWKDTWPVLSICVRMACEWLSRCF